MRSLRARIAATMSTKPPRSKPETTAAAYRRALRAGRVDISVEGDSVTLTLWARPGVASTVKVAQLERWALRQLREGVFA